MSLNAAAQGLAWFAVVITAGIAAVCIPDPRAGMRRLDHILSALPHVMLGRYLAITGFTAFVAVLGDLRVMAAWAVALSFMAFADTVIYARLGKPYMKHLTAGLAACAVLAVVLAAMISNGAA
jgi:hypothetical protein